MDFREFIQQFAERFGIQMPEIVDEAAAFDADGMPFFQALLDAGHNFAGAGGGVFARNPHDGHIWLQLREAFASIDVETAISKVKALGDAAINWRNIIREYREGASIPVSATADEGSAELPGGASVGAPTSGFMMV